MRNVIQWHQNSFFFKKIPKNRPATGGSVPRSPSVIRLNKLVYLHKSPNVDIFIFHFWFKPSPFRKLSVKCQTRPRLLIFHSTISLSNKNSSFENFWWLHCMWFLVCPPSPNQKSRLRLCTWDGISSSAPQITGWAPQARVNFCSSTTSKVLPKNR